MNKKLLFLPLIGCALFASCTEEGANDTNNQTELPKQAQGKTVTFKAAPLSVETKSLSTKVEVVPNGNNDDLKWSDETVSFFFLDDVAKNIYTDEADVSVSLWGAEMDVTIPKDPGTYDIYAISPSGSYFTTGTTTLTIDNQTQTGNDLSHLSPHIFLYSNPSTKLVVDENKNSTGEIPLSFDILSSLIRFDIVNNSNTAVTLNSITIKFADGGTLYKTATLNDFDGTLTYNGEVHDKMTLSLENASLNASVGSTFSAYMAAFPSNGLGDLLIVLNITASGRKSDINYMLSDSEILKGKRLFVGLEILDLDVVQADGTKYYTNGTNTYKTREFPTSSSGGNMLWMVQNSLEGTPTAQSIGSGHYYKNSNAEGACITPWRLPTYDEMTRLAGYILSNGASEWVSSTDITGMWLDFRWDYDLSSYNAWIGQGTNVFYQMYSYNPWVVTTFLSNAVGITQMAYPVRCVRDIP